MSASVLQSLLVISMIPSVLSGTSLETHVLTVLPQLEIAFRADALGVLFATTASLLWIVTSVYSIGYMRALKEHAQTRYFACFAVALAATLGVAFAANLFTLLVCYEVLTLITYPLVTHHETPEAITAGGRYVAYLFGAGKAFLLPAVILTYLTAGTLDFAHGGIFSGQADPRMLTVIYVLFLAGFAKAAIMPFHNWLPAAMVAPTPVSALLHAVAVVKVGVFSIARVLLDVFGVEPLRHLAVGPPTALVASVTILVASLIALSQDNLKRRLAYSTISQLSYVILGLALLSPAGLTGGLLQIANHAVGKITLFFCAGSIYVASHKTLVSELAGIGRRMPLTMSAFFLGALSMIGIPFLAGFTTKWSLAVGAIQADMLPILGVLLVSTMLNAGYFLPIVYTAFFKPPAQGDHDVRERPLLAVPLLITAAATVVIGFFPDSILRLVHEIGAG